MTSSANHGCTSSRSERGLFNGEVNVANCLPEPAEFPTTDSYSQPPAKHLGEQALAGVNPTDIHELPPYDPSNHPELTPTPKHSLIEALVFLHRPGEARLVHIRQIVEAMYKKRDFRLPSDELSKLIGHLNPLCDGISLLHLGGPRYVILRIDHMVSSKPT